jgi:hypothetical protein
MTKGKMIHKKLDLRWSGLWLAHPETVGKDFEDGWFLLSLLSTAELMAKSNPVQLISDKWKSP